MFRTFISLKLKIFYCYIIFFDNYIYRQTSKKYFDQFNPLQDILPTSEFALKNNTLQQNRCKISSSLGILGYNIRTQRGVTLKL